MKVFLSGTHFPSVPLRGTAGPGGTDAPEVNCPISRSTTSLHGDSPDDIIGGWRLVTQTDGERVTGVVTPRAL